MSTNEAAIAIATLASSNPLAVIADEIPFDLPYGLPISLDRGEGVIQAAVAEAKRRNWKKALNSPRWCYLQSEITELLTRATEGPEAV